MLAPIAMLAPTPMSKKKIIILNQLLTGLYFGHKESRPIIGQSHFLRPADRVKQLEPFD